MASRAEDGDQPISEGAVDSARRREKAVRVVLFLAASLAFVVTGAIIYTLVEGTLSFFSHPDVTWQEFFLTTEWVGVGGEFGVWALVAGTTLVSVGAVAVAGPLGIAAAVYLSEFADDRVRAVGKPLVEILAGIPSIVYGVFALITISPWVAETFDTTSYNGLSAIIVLAVMVLPIIVSLSDDAIRSVPDHLRDASRAMGATEWETAIQVTLPAARSGVFASIFLGLARALGETMAVFLAFGTVARFSLDPLKSGQTMTAYIARTATGDIPPGPAVDAGFAVGLVLFVITYTVNWGGQEILDRMGVEGA
jgi:phosphate transport system permease protein